MKSIPIFLMATLLSAQPLLSHAQVYKWKDKDGSIRYTDTPPPSNIQQETIIKKKTVATPINPLPVDSQTPPPDMDATNPQMRQRNAEAEKRNKQEQEAEAKRKADNCKAARANYQTYSQGGRVYKMNEKGEREYMDDKELNVGKEQAQREINSNCN